MVDGIRFTVGLPDRNLVDDPIPIHLRIENGSSQDIAVDWWHRSTAMLLNAGTNTAPFKDYYGGAVSQASLPHPHGTLHPGHSYETDLNLEQYFHLDPGTYSLSVSTIVWVDLPHSHSLELRAGPIPVDIESTR